MSTKPIFVATHPRACSTAFERVFMTQRSTIQCIHEPFGDAFYYGPERLSDRFEDDEQARLDSGFSESTYLTVLERIEREASEGKRVFIKDIDHYLLPPNDLPASVAPSLRRIKRGVGTNGEITNGVNGNVNGHAHANDHTATNGVYDTNGTVNGSSNTNGSTTNGHDSIRPYPYNTPSEPGNPTVMPREIQERFHWAFLIRDPHFSVPSYFRCTIPPLDKVTGFYNYSPLEAGYDELRRHFDFLRREGLIGPRVATRSDLNLEDESKIKETTDEICVIDADDMLDAPAATIEAFCNSVGLPYTPEMLIWDTPEDYKVACDAFEKWRGFHNDAIESSSLVARKHKHAPKSEQQFDEEWTEKYGAEAAAMIRQTVDANMGDYLYLKQFAVKV